MLSKNIKNQILKGKPFYNSDEIHNLFSWHELEKILNLSPFLNDLRFHILNNKKYEWNKYWWKTDNTAYPTNIIKEEIKHHVCYLQDASKINFSINYLANELESLTKLPTDAHIFFALTTNENEGLGIHNDISSNFIVQVEGETTFKVWDIIADEGIHNIKTIEKQPIIEVVMKKGDIIYIPKKYWHHAISKTKRLSVSFPMSFTDYKICDSREWIHIKEYL